MTARVRLAIFASLLMLAGSGVAFTSFCGTDAYAKSCRAKCQAKENQCRRAGGSQRDCNAVATNCLRGCRKPN